MPTLLNPLNTDVLRPEWVRCPSKGPEYYTGLTKPTLYKLANEGRIRSLALKNHPKAERGIRLFHLGSVLAYIERCEKEALEVKALMESRMAAEIEELKVNGKSV